MTERAAVGAGDVEWSLHPCGMVEAVTSTARLNRREESHVAFTNNHPIIQECAPMASCQPSDSSVPWRTSAS
jgi:hypothetical protein